jgi:hypothetical protein
MSIRRATADDQELIESICRTLDMPLPAPSILGDPRNIALLDGENVGLFLWRWIGIYEAHSLLTAKGSEARKIARNMVGLMLSGRAVMLLTVVPEPLRHVELFARSLGFRFRGEIETFEGLGRMYQLETPQWAS